MQVCVDLSVELLSGRFLLPRVKDLHSRSLKVVFVPGGEDEVVMQGECCDERIYGWHRSTCFFEAARQYSPAERCTGVQTQDAAFEAE